MDVITSTANETVRRVGRLSRSKERRETGLVLIEGPNLFAAAIERGVEFDTVLVTEDDEPTRLAAVAVGARTLVVTERVLNAIADAKHPRSPIASIVRPEWPVEATDGRNTVVMVAIGDPGNAGTIIRTAAAFGWNVAATRGSVDLWSPKTMRAAAGAHFVTPISQDVDLAATTAGRTMVATVARGGAESIDGSGPFALLIGGEAHGLPSDIVEQSDCLLTIRTSDAVESLNASVAAGIAIHLLSTKD